MVSFRDIEELRSNVAKIDTLPELLSALYLKKVEALFNDEETDEEN